MSANQMIEWALRYAGLGWRVVPLHTADPKGRCSCRKAAKCDSQGKHPRIGEWQKHASCDDNQILAWWDKWPSAGIGVALGEASGIVDIECDTDGAEPELVALFGGEIPPCPTFVSGRGKHRLFKWSGNLPGGACVHVGEVEVRTGNEAKGAQSVFPPSRHATAGLRRWLPGLSPDEVDPPGIPESVVAKLWNLAGEASTAPDRSAKPREHWDQIAQGVTEGGRNNAAAAFAGRCLASVDVHDNNAVNAQWMALTGWNNGNHPPLDEDELRRTFESILKREREQRGPAAPQEEPLAKGAIPVTREDALATINRAFRGKYGGQVVVRSVLKIGHPRGTYYLVTEDGTQIELGPIGKVTSVKAVRDTVLDQVGVTIPLNKKTWPLVSQCVVRLAEVRKTESMASRMTELLHEYAERCARFARYSEADLGTAEWWREKTLAFGKGTGEEFDRMIAATANVVGETASASWQRFLRGLWFGGLRLGEALELSWERQGGLSVELGGQYPALRIRGDSQKSGQDEICPVSPEFGEFLLQTPESERRGRVFRLVGIRGKTGPMGLEHVSAVIAKIGEEARVKVDERTKRDKDGELRKVTKWASAHDLRRSFGSRLAPRCSTAVLQRFMRHADIQTTMRYYVDLDADQLAAGLWEEHRKQSGNTNGNTAPPVREEDGESRKRKPTATRCHSRL